MQSLVSRGFDRALTSLVTEQHVPVLGICLGMQLMAKTGFEGNPTPGLGWIDADVMHLSTAQLPSEPLRVPHVGWNDVVPVPGARMFAGVSTGANCYFVHSYHLVPRDPAIVAATTPYGAGIVSGVQHGNVFGVQFHPEKSQRVGFRVLRNFVEL